MDFKEYENFNSDSQNEPEKTDATPEFEDISSSSVEEEFIDIAVSQLSYLKDDVIIHRLGADSATDDLIAPCWVRKKMSIVDKIDTFMKDNDIFQADNY